MRHDLEQQECEAMKKDNFCSLKSETDDLSKLVAYGLVSQLVV